MYLYKVCKNYVGAVCQVLHSQNLFPWYQCIFFVKIFEQCCGYGIFPSFKGSFLWRKLIMYQMFLSLWESRYQLIRWISLATSWFSLCESKFGSGNYEWKRMIMNVHLFNSSTFIVYWRNMYVRLYCVLFVSLQNCIWESFKQNISSLSTYWYFSS